MTCFLHVPTYREKNLSFKFYQRKAQNVDAIVFDFEDSVPQYHKLQVIKKLPEFVSEFKSYNQNIIFRLCRDYLDLQIKLINEQTSVVAVIWPKLTKPKEVLELQKNLRSDIGVIPVFETIESVLYADSYAHDLKNVAGLIFGPQDLSAELGIFPTQQNMLFAASKIKLLASFIKKPLWGVIGDFANLDDNGLKNFEKNLKFSKEVGFSGCFAIHPKQIAIIKRVYSMSEAEKIYIESCLKLKKDQNIQVINSYMHGPPSLVRMKKMKFKS